MNIKILIDEKEIKKRLKSLAKEIFKEFGNEHFTILALLNGSFIFLADFSRELSKLTTNFDILFLKLKSYSGKESTGKVKFYDTIPDVKDKNILIIDDIFDTGLTLKSLQNLIIKQRPKKNKLMVLLDKNVNRKIDLNIDYVGFNIPDKFVVGYGLDYNEKYRGLPYIGVVE